VVEVALRANLDLDLAVAAPGATIVTYADDGQGAVGVSARALMARNLTLRFVLLYTMTTAAREAAVAGVAAALGDNALQPRCVRRFTLDDAATAQESVAAGHPAKLLLDVG
jgi:NADPH2:quinone reductase